MIIFINDIVFSYPKYSLPTSKQFFSQSVIFVDLGGGG